MSQVADNPFPVVGVGSSAGGLAALTSLLDGLPSHAGLAIVVIQHLDPRHESRLSDLLRPHTEMVVTEAVHGATVRPGHLYVIQPNSDVAIVDGVLSVTPRTSDRRPHYPVDHFLRSLAAVQRGLSAAVILSGTGSDGTLGVCEVKAAGGVTFAQDKSAQYAGMPDSAVASGAVDLVLPPDEIGRQLESLARHPYLASALAPPTAAEPDSGSEPLEHDAFQRIIRALRRTSGVDFSQYRETTIKRRTARRMVLRGFVSTEEYAKFVERDRAEADALYRDVLINVTSFFRDPAMFEDLKERIFPAIVSAGSDATPIRVWVPGCSTGQEAYSLAMALLEFLEEVPASRSVQIFATDLGDPSTLERARAAVYPASIEAEVGPERLERFFTKEDGGYRVRKHVRELCVFARQNITVDPPFSRVDLLTCRNVLIYMSPPLQDRLLPVFHFALNPGGFLVLGVAETVGPSADLFEAVSREHKIYRKKNTASRPALTFHADDWLAGLPARRLTLSGPPPADYQREADRIALARYAPPGVLVSHDFDVLQYRGSTAPYLEAPTGQPTTNVLRMAREGVFMELRSALAEAKATRAPVQRDQLRVTYGGAEIEFGLRVLPVELSQDGEGCFLVLFETTDWPLWTAAVPRHETGGSEVRDTEWLRQELASSRQYLQSIVDQQDAAQQELRTAHEEVLSSNEELQSTNEELETTKEELQSANEELLTVNEQYQRRNQDLDALADDLSNFISSADLPMVTVGRDLRIRRLTPAAHRAFNLLPTDVGRSLAHINPSLAVDDLASVVAGVIASMQPWERDVRDREDRWWLLRVHPFRTSEGGVDGATLLAVDIDLAKRGGEILESRDFLAAILQAVREPLVVLEADGRVTLANEAFSTLFRRSAAAVDNGILWDSGEAPWSDPEVRRQLMAACTDGTSIAEHEVESPLPDHGLRTLIFNAKRLERDGRPSLLLLSVADVTEARQAEALRVDAETLRLLDRRKDEFLGILAHELRNPLAPMRYALDIMRRAEGRPPETTKARLVLERQVSHMVRIVDDLLDVSRITQGKVELRKEWLELSTVVNGAVELVRPAIAASRHTLTLSLPDEVVTFEADPVRITQVLVNLLNNAVKFTPTGGHIWLIAETTGDAGAGANQLAIRIRDTGVGMPPAAIPLVFDMFMQGDVSLERTRAGLGVGLTLVKNLVSLHGGSVEAHSEGEGTGSEFTVRLPLVPSVQVTHAEQVVAHGSDVPSLRVLVADDNDDGREMLSFLLTTDGHVVAALADGPSVLAGIEAFKPDVVILDIGMPGMHGYAVAESLRANPAFTSLPIVALSGLGQVEDKSRAYEAGFDRHFTKPVDVAALRAFLATVPAR